MAANTLRPTAAPARANVARPVAPPPAPEPVPVVAVAPEPVLPPEPAPTPPAAHQAEPTPPPTANPPRRKLAPEKPASTWSLFSLLDRFTGLDSFFQEGLPVQYLPHVLFVMLLTLLYIGNTHYGNRMNRNIQRLKLETEDLRADYTTLSSDYMEASKQSEVARKVAAIGLVESSSPPFRIGVPAGRLDGAELETMPVLTADTLAARAARETAAAQRADSLLGRLRQQQAGAADSSAADLEAGPPPPAPIEDIDSEPVGSASSAEQVKHQTELAPNSSLKRSKLVQNKPSPPRHAAKKNKASATTKGTAEPKPKPTSHERQR